MISYPFYEIWKYSRTPFRLPGPGFILLSIHIVEKIPFCLIRNSLELKIAEMSFKRVTFESIVIRDPWSVVRDS